LNKKVAEVDEYLWSTDWEQKGRDATEKIEKFLGGN
jgi:hypothetical protein